MVGNKLTSEIRTAGLAQHRRTRPLDRPGVGNRDRCGRFAAPLEYKLLFDF
jgi:hypothetical protein